MTEQPHYPPDIVSTLVVSDGPDGPFSRLTTRHGSFIDGPRPVPPRGGGYAVYAPGGRLLGEGATLTEARRVAARAGRQA